MEEEKFTKILQAIFDVFCECLYTGDKTLKKIEINGEKYKITAYWNYDWDIKIDISNLAKKSLYETLRNDLIKYLS